MSDNHIIGSGMTDQELAFANFWVRHGLNARSLGYGLLIAFSVLTWGFGLWSILDAYVISYPRESRIIQHIARNELDLQTLQTVSPQPIQPSDVEVFSTTDSRADFLVELTNPNANWWAEFTYRFSTGEEQTPARRGFILPSSQRRLTELGWKGKGRTGQLVIEDLRWHRIDPLQVNRDYSTFASQRLQLLFEEVKFEENQTTFTVKNPSGFGFWAVDVTTLLYRGGSPIAVSTVTLRELKPGEARPVRISWFENVNGVTKTDIQASVNILDPKAYLPSGRF